MAIFITGGMTIGLTDFSLSFDEAGNVKGNIALKLHFDVCPMWLGLAVGHLKDAREAAHAREAVWKGNDANAKGAALERELRASMQAIMCAAIAWDAFYAAIRDKGQLDPALSEQWRQSRLARWKQVAETIRTVFPLSAEGFEILRNALRQIYDFRDQAVHPSGSLSDPEFHPELGLAIERRFTKYRYKNALGIVSVSVEIIDQLATRAVPKNDGPKNYLAALRRQTNELRKSPELERDAFKLNRFGLPKSGGF